MAFWTRKQWLKNLAGLLLLPVALFMLFRWLEHSLVYQPSATLGATGAELNRPFQEVFFPSRDGTLLHGWFFPADKDSSRAHLTILFCHGNGGNISHRLDAYAALLDLGLNVFAFDYRGYGRSAGRPGEEGTYQDAQAAHAWLRQKGFVAPSIIAFGESLGGGVVSELALREQIGGLVLQSSFTSVTAVGAEAFPWLPVRSLGTIKYDTRSKLPRLRVPLLVMHGRADSVIPFHHGEENFAAANESKLFWELPGDHNDPVNAYRESFMEGMQKFLKMIGATR